MLQWTSMTMLTPLRSKHKWRLSKRYLRSWRFDSND